MKSIRHWKKCTEDQKQTVGFSTERYPKQCNGKFHVAYLENGR